MTFRCSQTEIFFGIFKPDDRDDFSLGGSGGILRRVTADKQTLWEYTIASKTELAHHDLEILPNGNVMTIVWEEIPTEQAYTDYYELAVDLKEDYVVNLGKKPSFTYLLNLKNIFHLLPEIKVSNIAEKANINPSLLRQYKTGKAKASEEQAKKVLNAMHELGKELLFVSF